MLSCELFRRGRNMRIDYLHHGLGKCLRQSPRCCSGLADFPRRTYEEQEYAFMSFDRPWQVWLPFLARVTSYGEANEERGRCWMTRPHKPSEGVLEESSGRGPLKAATGPCTRLRDPERKYEVP